MAYQPAPNVARVNTRYTVDGQLVENVLHFVGNPPIGTADLQALAVAVRSVVLAYTPANAPTSVTLREISVTDLTTAFGEVVVDTTGLPAVGVATPEKLPNNVTLCLKLVTSARGRSGRGRFYVPYLREDEVQTNTVRPATIATWIDLLQDIRSAAQAVDWLMVVLSRQNEGVLLAEAVARLVTNIVSTDATVDSQRRRLPGRGI